MVYPYPNATLLRSDKVLILTESPTKHTLNILSGKALDLGGFEISTIEFKASLPLLPGLLLTAGIVLFVSSRSELLYVQFPLSNKITAKNLQKKEASKHLFFNIYIPISSSVNKESSSVTRSEDM